MPPFGPDRTAIPKAVAAKIASKRLFPELLCRIPQYKSAGTPAELEALSLSQTLVSLRVLIIRSGFIKLGKSLFSG
jgi:hypothetical protein